MKFVCEKNANLAKREYDVYTYLNAIFNPDVERYGIPSIYYYNRYGEYQLMVLSLFECNLLNKESAIQVIDNLIVFRDFVSNFHCLKYLMTMIIIFLLNIRSPHKVRQSKYIHSRKIRHDDIKPDNIMFRKHRSFLIDFNLSSKFNETNSSGTFGFLPRSAYLNIAERTPLDDWESFLYTMSKVNKVDLEWFDKDFIETRRMCGIMKQKTNETIARIKAKITDEDLQEVFVAFAHEAFKENRSLPSYDYFDDMIMKKIALKKGDDQPALFSWLSEPDRNAAVNDLRNNPLVKATDIEFNLFDYPDVEYDYFAVQMDDMARKQKPSRENYLKKKAAMTKQDKKKRSSCSKNFLSKCFK